MVVKPQHIYGSYIFSWKKASQSHTYQKFQIQQKIEAMHTIKLQVHKTWNENYTFSKQLY